jgi:carboxynorspermidine decarboxylase
MSPIDFTSLPTPAYVMDERLLIKNLEILEKVIARTGCKILLAQKAFSMFSLYPLIGKYLSGTTASSLFEAKLGFETMGKEIDSGVKEDMEEYSESYKEIMDSFL